MKPSELFKKAQAKEPFALSRMLTLVENNHPAVDDFLKLAQLTGHRAPVFGITGPPGAGKSTLTDQLILEARKQGKRVCVFAVDPSSPFSGGAILGDRIRMLRHSTDENVFIRSLGTRGRHGGLSACTFNAVELVSSLPFDVVFIETVGVGQTELDIMTVANTVVVVLVPESGDGIQVMKSGLMEVGDIYVVNKSDRPNADLLIRDLTNFFHDENKDRGVLKTIASTGVGVPELFEECLKRNAMLNDLDKNKQRARAHIRHLIVENVEAKLIDSFKDPKAEQLVDQVLSKTLSVKEAAVKFSQLFVTS